MKKLKMKDIILEHYQKVHELEMHGLTVRVWKPRTMQQLPAYNMLEVIESYTKEAKRSEAISENKSEWLYGNPDWGLWDALLVRYIDARHKTLDIYFAAILVRPFSREAQEWYERHCFGLSQQERLMLMWDSREYDRIHCFDTSHGAYKNQEEADRIMYRVVDKERDLRDNTPSSYLQVIDEEDEFSPIKREQLTLRQMPDGKTEYYVITDSDETQERGGTPLMHAAAKCYTDFRKEHPEVTEMRIYTDKLVETEYADGTKDAEDESDIDISEEEAIDALIEENLKFGELLRKKKEDLNKPSDIDDDDEDLEKATL